MEWHPCPPPLVLSTAELATRPRHDTVRCHRGFGYVMSDLVRSVKTWLRASFGVCCKRTVRVALSNTHVRYVNITTVNKTILYGLDRCTYAILLNVRSFGKLASRFVFDIHQHFVLLNCTYLMNS